MKPEQYIAVAVASSVLGPAVASAAPIGIFSTGLGTPGSIDPKYTVVSSPDPSYPGPAVYVATPLPVAYVADNAASSWVCLTADANTSFAPGVYDYRTTFDLTGLIPSTAALSGNWASDNGAVMLLNGTPTGNTLPGGTAPYQSLTPFSVTSGFAAGVNSLDFLVTNELGTTTPDTPSALRVQISGTAAVPEPATLGLLAAGGLAVLGRRRKTVMRTEAAAHSGPSPFVPECLAPINGLGLD